jgi:hypothetical protein
MCECFDTSVSHFRMKFISIPLPRPQLLHYIITLIKALPSTKRLSVNAARQWVKINVYQVSARELLFQMTRHKALNEDSFTAGPLHPEIT